MYTVDMFKHQQHRYHTAARTRRGRPNTFLFLHLSHATTAAEPQVTRIYYFRYDEDQPVALIVNGTPTPFFCVIGTCPH